MAGADANLGRYFTNGMLDWDWKSALARMQNDKCHEKSENSYANENNAKHSQFHINRIKAHIFHKNIYLIMTVSSVEVTIVSNSFLNASNIFAISSKSSRLITATLHDDL